MRALILILIFMAVPLAGGELKASKEADYWKDTGVDQAFAARMISNAECSETEFHFHACRKALIEGALLLNLKNDRRFRPLFSLKFQKDYDFDSLLTSIAEAKTKLPKEMVLGKVVTGYMHSLDPYAKLWPTGFVELLYNGEKKTYFSLGIETSATRAGISIFHVYPNTPASLAGLRMHDRIVAINGIRMRDELDADAMARDLHGGVGAKFILEIQREGRRSTIEVSSSAMSFPEWTPGLHKVGAKQIGYYRIHSFSNDSCLHLQQQLEIWQNSGTKIDGLILDLRHNLGGFVEEGKCVAQLFAGDQTVISREKIQLEFPESLQIEKTKTLDTIDSYQWRQTFDKLPLVVLIDERSASASELAAGALQDLGRAWVVGERSYGKGTTQLIHHLQGFPKLRVIKTVSRYLRPHGMPVQGVGVTPNFEIPFLAQATIRERTFAREENLQKTVRTETPPVWQETRKEKAAAIGKCLAKVKAERDADFQLANALNIFSCEP